MTFTQLKNIIYWNK